MKTMIFTSVLNMQRYLNHTYPTAQKNLDTTKHNILHLLRLFPFPQRIWLCKFNFGARNFSLGESFCF